MEAESWGAGIDKKDRRSVSMGDEMSGVMRLSRDRLKPAAEVIARAFQDYPLSVYFHPDENERRERQPYAFQAVIRYCLLYGEVYATSPNLEGVAAWIHSDKAHRTLWRNIRSGGLSVLFRLGRRTMQHRAYGEFVNAMRKRYAPLPHMYLQVIGVDPVHQGKGYASALLRAMFARTDGEGLPCYLETQAEKNVAIYEHHGFRVVEEGKMPGSDVRTWAMLRERGH